MPLPLVILLMPFLLLALPALLPIAAAMDARERRHRGQLAQRSACPRCGSGLGLAALDRADAAWRDECAERQARHPHVMWRVVRRVWAVCGTCGAGYGYKDGAFRPEPAGFSPAATSAASGSEPGRAPPSPPG